MDELSQFRDLLVQLQSAEDPTLRRQAELRNFGLIILRRLISNSYEEMVTPWEESTLEQFRGQMLLGLQEEQDPQCRRRWCDVVAEYARNTLDEELHQQWPQVLQFLFNSANSESEELKLASLQIFRQCPSVFGNQQEHYLMVIKEMLAQSLVNRSSLALRTCAFVATVNFLVENEDDNTVIKAFGDALPAMLTVCKEAVDADDANERVLDSLVELTIIPKFLRPRLSDLIVLCMSILNDPNQDDDSKHQVLEVLVSFSENAAPAMRKDGKAAIPELVKKCLEMMVDLEEEENWHLRETDDEDDSSSNSTVGETSLDRLCIALGAKVMISPCFENIHKLLISQDWKHRYAGLMAVSAIGEGCLTMMETILPKVVETVLPYLKDPHVRVRYAACNAIGQLSSDFSPTLQKRHHAQVLDALLSAMQENEAVPRVQAHCAAAMVNFCEECPKAILAPYLQPVMEKLEHVLENKFRALAQDRKMVLEQVITTIAAIADASEDAFIPYYDRVVPCLKYILENATSSEFGMLRGKTIECLSLIGLAVGSEKFKPDSHQVMELLLKNHQSLDDSNASGDAEAAEDPTTSFMISAWTRICKLMGPEFQQYLPMVMPAVMKAASHKPDVAVVENEEVEQLDQSEWQFVSVGDQQNFGIRTTYLEDKANACQMLVCYARELKEAFAPYVEQVTMLMVPMLKFFFHDDVRTSASEIMPYLLESAKIKGDDFVREMWRYIAPELLKAIEGDTVPECTSEHMAAFAECVEVLGTGCCDEYMDELLRILEKSFTKYFDNQRTRAEKRHGEDYDEEVEAELIEEDEEDEFVLSKITDITHALFGTYGPAFAPYFDKLMPAVQQLLQPNRPLQDLQWSICMVDDIVEYAPADSVRYAESFVEPFYRALKSENPAVRQAAAYGFGLMGQSGLYKENCKMVVPILAEMVEDKESRTTAKNVSATENAISAIAKIIKGYPEIENRDAMIAHWLTWLPTWEDNEESEHIYGFLADLIENNHHTVLDSNLPRVVGIIGEAQLKGAFEECPVARLRLANAMKTLKNNTEIYKQCMAQLTQAQGEAVNQLTNL